MKKETWKNLKHGKVVCWFNERKIMPKKFVLVERRNTYSQICLEAYCYLREDDRIFAVYRIEEIND